MSHAPTENNANAGVTEPGLSMMLQSNASAALAASATRTPGAGTEAGGGGTGAAAEGAGAGDPRDTRTSVSTLRSLNGPLVGLLGGHHGGLSKLTSSEQRVYVSTLESRMKLGGKTSVSVATIAHKIEGRGSDADRLFGDALSLGGSAISQEFTLESSLAEAADRRLDTRRGNVAVSANFVRNDHSRIVGRLAAALARYSRCGELTFTDLSGNSKELYNRDKIDGRIEEGSDCIYIPRVSANEGESWAWYAVVGAALGGGNKVITDTTAVDSQNRALINAPGGAKLAMGCAEALVRMCNYYAASDAAVMFAWAVVKGLHDELSLVGHTDEGGYVRSVIRRNRFVRSYGVVWLSVERSGAIPVPIAMSMSSAARFCDQFLVYSGAISAIADPLVKSGDDYYPSVYSTGETQETIMPLPPGTKAEQEAWAIAHACSIHDTCGEFCTNYANLLDGMLQAKSNAKYLDKVEGYLVACFATMTKTPDRHLMHRTVAPFYWIEPQNVVGTEVKDYAAQKHRLGAYVLRGETEAVYDPFEPGSKSLDSGSAFVGSYYIAYTAARKNAIFQHLINNEKTSLSCFIPRMTREDGLSLVGCRAASAGSFTTRACRNDDLVTYMWSRASSGTFAPAEANQFCKGMSIMVVFAMLDENLNHRRIFEGDPGDMGNKVTFFGTQPQGVGHRVRNKPFSRDIVRSNGLCVAAIGRTRSLTRAFGDMFTQMPVSASGSAPGINVIEEIAEDPRRLVVMGATATDQWEKFAGKVQKTVISHRLRHRRQNLQHEKQILSTGATGKGEGEGGAGVTAVGAEDDKKGIPNIDDCGPETAAMVERLNHYRVPESLDAESKSVFPVGDRDQDKLVAEVEEVCDEDDVKKERVAYRVTREQTAAEMQEVMKHGRIEQAVVMACFILWGIMGDADFPLRRRMAKNAFARMGASEPNEIFGLVAMATDVLEQRQRGRTDEEIRERHMVDELLALKLAIEEEEMLTVKRGTTGKKEEDEDEDYDDDAEEDAALDDDEDDRDRGVGGDNRDY